MARSFDGVDDSGAVSPDLSSTQTITISFWLLWDTFANDDDLAFEFTANYNNNQGGFIVDPNAAAGAFEVGIRMNSGVTRRTVPRPSEDVWHHYGAVMDMGITNGEVGPITVDGVAQSLTVTGQGSGAVNFANAQLNMMSRNQASLFGAGDLAEIAIWSVALSGPQLAALAAGASPADIQTADLELYVPLNGDTPELDLGPNGYTVTIVGATPTAGPSFAPTAPTNLTATAISATQIDLAWDDNASDETSFRVERSPTGAGGWSTVGTPAADEETFSNTGLTCEVEYFYRVYAVNGVGDSSPSNTDSVTTLACPPPPTAGGNRMGGTGAIRKPPRPLTH